MAAAEKMLQRCIARRSHAATRRRSGGGRGVDHRRCARLGRLQEGIAARLSRRAPSGRRSTSRHTVGHHERTSGEPFRASKPAPKSRAAPNTSTICACRACCTARSSAAPSPHGRIRSHRHQRRARRSKACIASSPARTSRSSFPIPITARRSTISRSWRSRKCATSASRSPSCWPTTRTSPMQAVQLISAEYDELPAVFDEVEALKPDMHRARRAEAGRHVRRPQASRRTSKGTNVALDYHLRRGDVDAAFARADHVFEHTFKTQQVLHMPLEPFVSVAEPGDRHADHPHVVADAVVRAHRDRAAARLAGEPRAREGAVSRRRLRREGLHQARSAGRGAGAAGAPAGRRSR